MLHHAAFKGHTDVIQHLLDLGADINHQDNKGFTPLHEAIRGDRVEVINKLMSRGADVSLATEKGSPAVHYAVEESKPRALEALVSYDWVDVDATAFKGCTGLHYAAYNDEVECAQILINYGAHISQCCDIGLYPIHVAAMNASQKTMKLLIEEGVKRGYTRDHLLQFTNHEKSTPLHIAVTSGCPKSVTICVENGGKIDLQQDDGSTPVHLACARGMVDILKLMFSIQPERKITSMKAKEIGDLTPLHRAVIFDWSLVVEYMLEEGADLDPVDCEGRSPLLLAASKRAWNCVAILLKNKAKCTLVDKKNRNILHLIIQRGGKPEVLLGDLGQKKLTKLLKQTDDFGCTPLHYASKEGQLTTINELIKLGATLHVKNKHKQSPLHFAARYGRYNTCRRLLENAINSRYLNDTDEEGRTPLHVAAANGHDKIVKLLLHMGATIVRDIEGNTALHLAAANGYTHCMQIILDIHGYMLDATKKEMNTALHVASIMGHPSAVTLLLTMDAKILLNSENLHFLDEAIRAEHKDVCIAIITHDRWKEAMDKGSTLYGCPMVGMIKHMPEVCQMILDRCRTSMGDPKTNDFRYHYDFRFMECAMEEQIARSKEGKKVQPMLAVNMMVKYNRVECLSHPVCIAFLQMKWCAYGLWIHVFNLICYLVFLASLTAFVVSTDIGQVPLNMFNLTAFNQTYPHDGKKIQLHTGHMMELVVLLIFCGINAVKEVLQMVQQKWKYFVDFTNLLEWILYISTVVFVVPFLCDSNMANMHWEAGTVAIFLAWVNLLLFLQRFDFFGIYVVMFLEILKTLIQVLVVFSILIIAFGLAFYILMSSQDAAFGHKTPELSLVSTVVMMMGSIQYMENYVEPYITQTLQHQTLSFLLLILFLFLMPILLINLLIGLAVGDIEAIQHNARLKRLAMQVELHTGIEKRLPFWFLKMVDRMEVDVYPNSSNFCLSRIWNKIKLTGTRGISYTQDDDESLTQPSEAVEHQAFLYTALDKQKKRLKEMSTDISKQHDMLRLIIQKMEIKTEAEHEDDSLVRKTSANEAMKYVQGIGWSSPALRHTLLKQSGVISKWRGSFDKTDCDKTCN